MVLHQHSIIEFVLIYLMTLGLLERKNEFELEIVLSLVKFKQ